MKRKFLPVFLCSLASLSGWAQQADQLMHIYAAPIDTQGTSHLSTLPVPNETFEAVAQATRTGRALASPLSSVVVTKVEKQREGTGIIDDETISSWQKTTLYRYSESVLFVTTEEMGYGSAYIAKYKNSVLNISNMVANDPLCLVYGIPSNKCKPGNPVIGFRKRWRLNGPGNGLFTFQSTSINYPKNTYT